MDDGLIFSQQELEDLLGKMTMPNVPGEPWRKQSAEHWTGEWSMEEMEAAQRALDEKYYADRDMCPPMKHSEMRAYMEARGIAVKQNCPYFRGFTGYSPQWKWKKSEKPDYLTILTTEILGKIWA